ncbi:vitellogenin-1 [Drosophila nasuta]|uniref:vitellogenin-1 n=1 Tax=Drosophila nasuta TaxID=42062 RepID=UPI00295F1066|nr:vitellogenin-1 [Drosophila nasuta]
MRLNSNLKNQLIVLMSLALCIDAKNSSTDWWQGMPYAFMDILTMKMNLFTALPLEVGATVIDTLCSSTLFMTGVPPQITPDITKMHFQYMTPCLNYTVPLLEAEKLWMHPKFRQNRKLVILATGWTNTVNDSSAIAMISKAFMCRPGVNFVIVDAAYYVDTLYKWSALNTDLIGEQVAMGLQHLNKAMPWMDIHLIGHSLGAHIMGTAGRTFKKLSGHLVSRITGLDPAKPCFRYEKALPGLQKGDASLVDVIHTNCGILAKRDPLGDIDFYPGGAHPIKPGCLTIGCSHTRAVEYFAESVYPEHQRSFLGMKCDSWTALKRRKCISENTSTMGYLINRKARGIYYVDVNGWSPFGKADTVLASKHFACDKTKCLS